MPAPIPTKVKAPAKADGGARAWESALSSATPTPLRFSPFTVSLPYAAQEQQAVQFKTDPGTKLSVRCGSKLQPHHGYNYEPLTSAFLPGLKAGISSAIFS